MKPRDQKTKSRYSIRLYGMSLTADAMDEVSLLSSYGRVFTPTEIKKGSFYPSLWLKLYVLDESEESSVLREKTQISLLKGKKDI